MLRYGGGRRLLERAKKIVVIFSLKSKYQRLKTKLAEVAELADAHGLGPCGATRGSSNLPFGTRIFENNNI